MRSIVEEKSIAFAHRIMDCTDYIMAKHKKYSLCDQLFRSGTSIGANIAESINAQSKADFVSKLSISLKEATETKYWLELLHDSGNISDQQFDSVVNDLNVIIGTLIKTIKKTRENGI